MFLMRENDVERTQLLMKRIIGFNKNNFIQHSFSLIQYKDDKSHIFIIPLSKHNIMDDCSFGIMDNLPRQFQTESISLPIRREVLQYNQFWIANSHHGDYQTGPGLALQSCDWSSFHSNLSHNMKNNKTSVISHILSSQ